MVWRILCGFLCLPLLVVIAFILQDARAHRYGVVAQTAYQAGRYQVAALSVEQALQLGASNAELWLERAEIERSRWLLHRQNGSEERMKTSFERAAALSPFWAQPLDSRSQVEAAVQDYPAALRSNEAAIARAPSSGTYRVLQGQYLELSGDTAGAVQAYQKALSLYDSPEATAALARLGVKP